MLTVPDSIKELLHQDTCKKNIRIHFPNGERSDICNDLIVKNSVVFTESLCSQDDLKFGLCENSVFECETVGVGNIKGAKIEVACEIYCDEETQGAEWKMDLQAWVYSIPYGRFEVAEAKRQADMIHRKITAYSFPVSNVEETFQFENAKSRVGLSSAVEYTPSMIYFSEVNGFRFSDETYDITTKTRDASSHPYQSQSLVTPSYLNPGYYLYIYIGTMDYYYMGRVSGTQYDNDTDCILEVNGSYEGVFAELNKICDDLVQTPYLKEGYRNKLMEVLISYFTPRGRWRSPGHVVYSGGCGPTKPRKQVAFYPFINGYYSSSTNKNFTLNVPYGQVAMGIADSSFTHAYYYHDFDIPGTPVVRKKKIKSTYPDYKLKFPRVKKVSADQETYYTIDFSGMDVEALQDKLNAMIELYGYFGYIKRGDGIFLENIKQQFHLTPSGSLYPDSDLYPQGVTGGKLLPQDYQSCWYDDDFTKPYGAIRCKYKDSNNQEAEVLYFLDGYDSDTPDGSYKTYELDRNSIIEEQTWTQSQIEDICEIIASNIEGVTYMPVEFVGRGLPYVEAGDTFEILTKSNDSITTIVLHKTTAGEITLTDTYKST